MTKLHYLILVGFSEVNLAILSILPKIKPAEGEDSAQHCKRVKDKIEGGPFSRTANIDIWRQNVKLTGRNRRRGWNKAAWQVAADG